MRIPTFQQKKCLQNIVKAKKKKKILIKIFVNCLNSLSNTLFKTNAQCLLSSEVSAVAQQVLWNCLIEDPSTVLRHFLEKLTISNRQVNSSFFVV